MTSKVKAPVPKDKAMPEQASWASASRGEDYPVKIDTGRLLASMPFPMYLCTADGVITAYNEAAVQLWGRAPQPGAEKWCGSHRLLALDGTEMPRDSCALAKSLRTGVQVDGEEVIIERPDGSRRYVTAHPRLLFDTKEELLGGVNILMDVTGHRESVIAQAHLAAIVASSDDAIISKDLTSRIISWNAGAERIFGYTAEEAIGKSITMIIPQDRQDEEEYILSRLRAGERIDHYQTIRVAKDGRLLDISLTVSPVRDDTGKIVGASKVARDITEIKRHSITQKLLAAIVESSDDAIISKDLQGNITSWNRAASEIYGYTAEEVVGQSVMVLIPEERHEEELDILRRLVAGERIVHFETKRRRKTGQIFDVSLTVSPIRDDTGAIIGASKVARDISEQKRAQRQLLKAKQDLERRVLERTEALRALAIELSRTEQRERKRLAQALHDDIQQILVAVKIHTSFVPRNDENERALADVLRLADEAIAACRALVIGLSPPLVSDTDLPSAITWLARHMKEQHGLQVEIVRADCPHQLHEDVRMLIFEIARELLFNVVKHSGVNKAQLSLHCPGDQLELSISDKGIGCESAAATQINHGSFGLFSIRERLTGLGGSFHADTSPGAGCTMTVSLPVKVQ